MNLPRHYLRFGKFSEKDILQKHKDCFEAIVFNANSIAYYGKSLSTFMFIKNCEKKFFIDPMTYAFQLPLTKISDSKGYIKSSIKKLIKHYGQPITSKIKNSYQDSQPVTYDDFNNDEIIENFVENVLKFQENHLFYSADDSIKPYLEEFRDSISTKPVFLVAPYFYLESFNTKLLNLNKKFIRVSKELRSSSNFPIAGELVMTKELLEEMAKNHEIMDKVLEVYSEADILLFWIDDFNEHTQSLNNLKNLKQLISSFKKKFNSKPVINLYGGYFSELLIKSGLYGVVHGPEYGESRSVSPVGGGIPISKFYFPMLKRRLASNEIIWLLNGLNVNTARDFHKKVCQCKVCKKLIKGKSDIVDEFVKNYASVHPVQSNRYGFQREYPDLESIKNSLAHYLEVKKAEFKKIKESKIGSLLKELKESHKKVSKLGYFDEREIKYLLDWEKALKE